MPSWHPHLQCLATVSQVLRHQHRRFFADEQRGAVRVASYVVRADGEVGTLETFDAMNVETIVEDAVFDDGVAGARGH